MPLAPLVEIDGLLKSMTPQAFSERHATEDVVVVEPFNKDWDYHGPFHAGTSYMFVPKLDGEPIPVGRDERATVQIDHAAVSRLHVVLAFASSAWQIMDRSSNGSWLDGQRLDRDQAVELPYGTPLRLGRAVVIRVLRPTELQAAVASMGPPTTQAPARVLSPPSDPGSSTWRFPSAARDSGRLAGARPMPPQPPSLPARPPATPSPELGEIELDFDFGDLGGHPLTAPGGAPAPPQSPPAQARALEDEDIDFDIEFDDDNRGGFA